MSEGPATSPAPRSFRPHTAPPPAPLHRHIRPGCDRFRQRAVQLHLMALLAQVLDHRVRERRPLITPHSEPHTPLPRRASPLPLGEGIGIKYSPSTPPP